MISTIQEFNEYWGRRFRQHLVVLGCMVRFKHAVPPHDKWQIFLGSGFVLCNGDNWYFATAGHCLKELHELLKQKGIEHYRPFLKFDFENDSEAVEPRFFDLEKREFEFIDEDKKGIDLGLLKLQHLEIEAFKKAEKIPLTEDKWMSRPSGHFDCHFIVGTPNETAYPTDDDGTHSVTINASTFVIRPVDAEPDKIKPDIPWLSFAVSDSIPLKSIVGMSGGPIFGLRQIGNQINYWVVAVQSQWNAPKRIAFACRMPEFSRIFELINGENHL